MDKAILYVFLWSVVVSENVKCNDRALNLLEIMGVKMSIQW